jgi:uncharacterized protein (DUF924 family)
MSNDWTADLLAFWFEELAPAQWFEKSLTVDQRIKERFGGIYETVAARDVFGEFFGPPLGDVDRERAWVLAHIILLDQFPRNMFRGTARMFASDAAALPIARSGLARRLDEGLDTNHRLFFYLPFEHSEDLADQERSVRLFEDLGHAEYLRYAEAHREIIARFGRFPHRNGLLGRESTPEEIAFLQQPGSSF